jgi:hypothetical protein
VRILAPLLLITFVNLIADRGRLEGASYWVPFASVTGTAVLLGVWGVLSFRAIRRPKAQPGHNKNSRSQSIVYLSALLAAIGFAILPGAGRPFAWKVVNSWVVIRMLIIPITLCTMVSLKVWRALVSERERGPKLHPVRTAITTIEWVPDVVPKSSRILDFGLPLFALGMAVGVGWEVFEALKTGNTRSPWVFGPFDESRAVFLESSPEEFWTYIEIYAFCALIFLGAGADMLAVWGIDGLAKNASKQTSESSVSSGTHSI